MLEAAAAMGGQGMTPFYTLLDGGRDGKFYKVGSRFCLFHMLAKSIIIFIPSS